MDSKRTPRYHKVGHNSSVDESLFGKSPRSATNGRSRKIVTAPIPANSVVLSTAELNRLKNAATIKTEEELRQEREAALRQQEEREKISRDRKARMIALEEKAKKNAKKSDAELAKAARDQAIREMAEEKLVDETDLVKMLTTLGARAAAFTIRDRQLEEKKKREEAELEYDRRLDMMMEVDRLKDLQRRDEEENYKRSKRFEDRKVITEQIEERRRMKLIAAEAREQENIAMRNMIQKYAEEDKRTAEKRRAEVERSRLEVLAANEKAIQRKKDAKLQEKMEMDEILRYQAQRDAELARREEEEARKELLKKEQQAKLLASQERSQNKQAELDELRARRAAEAHDRKIREQEREMARKRKAELQELTQARTRQAEEKKNRMQAQKDADLIEIEHAKAYAAKMAEREAREEAHKARLANEHRENIRIQIEEAEQQRAR